MSVSPDLIVGGLVTLVGGGGLWAYLGARGKTQADLITIAHDAAGKAIAQWEHIVKRQDERITELEAQDERCREELANLKRRMDER